MKESLNNVAIDGSKGEVASILSESQIRRLQSSQSLKEAKVTDVQKNQLIKSIVSRYEDLKDGDSVVNASA